MAQEAPSDATFYDSMTSMFRDARSQDSGAGGTMEGGNANFDLCLCGFLETSDGPLGV